MKRGDRHNFFESLGSGFSISEKKIVFLFWAWPRVNPCLYKLCQKMVIFRGFSKFFSELTGFQLKLLILIESPNIFHWKTATTTTTKKYFKVFLKV